MKQYTRLRKKQKEAVLSWIAEGLETDEINARADKFKPPFTVSRQQVDYYRATRELDLKTIARLSETQALTSGYALKEERVKALQTLADLMYRDLTNGFLWLEQAKALGSGLDSQIMEYEEFNTAETQQLRGVFDDIAKEIGHRRQIIEGGDPSRPLVVKATQISDDDLASLIANLTAGSGDRTPDAPESAGAA